VGVVGIALGVLAVLGVLFLPHSMTCTSSGDCRTDNDLLFTLASLGRFEGGPFAAAGVFALGLSLLTAAFRPHRRPAAGLDDLDDIRDPRREAIMTTESAPRRAPAPARALWTFAIVVFIICAGAAVFVSLPMSQTAFGTSCDENGCSYSPLYTLVQIAGFLAPSMMIAALVIAALAIVASTINRHGGIRLDPTDGRDDDAATDSDPDAELDALLDSATDDLDRARSRSRGAGVWRGGDLTPFMRPSNSDGRDGRD
jgi:hypothetical protein